MSLDQCHSTVGELPAAKPRAVANTQIGVTGKAYWRGLDDVADTPEFRDMLEKEFPSGASQLLASSRRTFLKLMGASVALAGAATLPGCRRPDHKIMPYSREVPEDVVPGKSLYYATSIALPGGAVEGLVVESHEGRPTKIEGNPLHPGNNGKSSARAQASVLSLYDPDRLKDPVFTPEGNTPRSWADFAAWCSAKHLPALSASKGAGLAILVDKRRSPSRDAMKKRVLEAYPKAMWVAYDPTESDGPTQATVAAFGKPMREVLELGKADVVVSLDRDFLYDDASEVRNVRGFAAKRRVLSSSDTMSRIYCVESTLSVTGAKADHRLALPPSHVAAFAVALAQKVMGDGAAKGSAALKSAVGGVTVPGGVSIDQKFVDVCAADLLKDDKGTSRAGKTLVCCGPTQPAAVQALVIALNAALGNINQTVKYRAMGVDEAASSVGGLKTLVDAMNAGAVTTLVTIGANPVYNAPGDLGFAQAAQKVPMRIAASVGDSETIAAAHWQLPMAHDLEAWGDLESVDGTVSPIQPLIAPLFGAKSDLEILAIIAGDTLEKADGHAIVQAAHGIKGDGDKAWKRALFNGVFAASDAAAPAAEVSGDKLAAMIGSGLPAPATADRFDVVFTMGQTGDGSMANNGWLQELSDPITKIVWDNVALISAATATRFGLDQEAETSKIQHARMVQITVGNQTVRVPAWVCPGIADNTVVLQFGYGRTNCGRVGEKVGFNVYPISGVGGGGGGRRMASGATIGRVSDGEQWYPISSTQSHGSMEGRAIVREVDLPAWATFGADPFKGLSEIEKKRLTVDSYKNPRDLNFAERLGELSHTPANYNAYVNPQRGLIQPPGLTDKTPTVAEGKGLWGSAAATFDGTPRKPDFALGTPQWGMSIDMTTCTGCGACTTACQAENNIPIVGKTEIRKQRDMQWIRVDRYFSGDSRSGLNAASVVFQPVACVHCENAPCETVCPVNATVHGPEGINYMVYNRCIGTRYCANNCPYKVRRFNFFDYGVAKFNGDYIGKETLGSMGPNNVNLVPPRLRERLDEITKLGMNPNVTVRSRGVMEKCNYCLQRVNEARIQVKLKNLAPKTGETWGIPDGFFQVACQQACPADAIVFGDINDTKTQYPEAGGAKRTGSRLFNMRENGRSYLLLGYINTRPRTTHMVSVRNPNLALVSDEERLARMQNPFHHGHDDHGGHGDHDHGSEGDKHAPAAPKGAEHGMLFDKSKLNEDRGYRLSLAVLGVMA